MIYDQSIRALFHVRVYTLDHCWLISREDKRPAQQPVSVKQCTTISQRHLQRVSFVTASFITGAPAVRAVHQSTRPSRRQLRLMITIIPGSLHLYD